MSAGDTVTWWGCATVELYVGGRRLVIDPYLHPTEPRADYIFVTHDDYDHCHEPTLRSLTVGPAFERLVVPPSCLAMSRLDSPTHGEVNDLAFVEPDRITVLYPKHTREPRMRHPGPTELSLDGFHVETVDSSERPQRFKRDPGSVWPEGTGNYVADAEYPNIGFVITADDAELTVYHPGDLGEVFDALRALRDRIDMMFFPVIKLQGMELTIVDAVRPRLLVPIHYRLNTPNFPVPLDVTQADLTVADLATGSPTPGADPALWRDDIHRMMQGHWYPTPDPPLERLRRITPQLETLGAKVAVLEAGRPYDLASLCGGAPT